MRLPGKVRELFVTSLAELRRRYKDPRLRLRIEPLQLAALPWEFALLRQSAGEAVANDFLCLHRDVSITRYEVIGEAAPRLKPKEKFKIIIALASPIGLPELDLKADEKAILDAVRGLNARIPGGAIETGVLHPATREALLKAAAGADIFHFGGHGLFEGATLAEDGSFKKTGKIALEKEDGSEDRIESDRLAQILSRSDVRLAVLGACSTASRDAGGAWSGVAPALVRGNIPAVLAMQFKMADICAPRFFDVLDSLALAGCTIDQAVAEARHAVFVGITQGSADWATMRDWGVPVLYLRVPDGLLFPVVDQAQASAGDPGSALLRIRQELGSSAAKWLAPRSIESALG